MLSCLGGAPRNVKAISRDVPIRRDDLDEMQHAKAHVCLALTPALLTPARVCA